MADKKKIIGLSALVVGGILFMAWLAGLLHFGKIAPGLDADHRAAASRAASWSSRKPRFPASWRSWGR